MDTLSDHTEPTPDSGEGSITGAVAIAPPTHDEETTHHSAFAIALMLYRSSLEASREFFLGLTPAAKQLDAARSSRFQDANDAIMIGVRERNRPDETYDLKVVIKLLRPESAPDFEIPDDETLFRTAVGRDLLGVFVREMQDTPRRSHYETLASSVVTNIVTLFETLLSDLMLAYYRLYPGATSGEEKVFSLDELRTYQAIDDAVESLVAKRIAAFIAGSTDEWQKDLHKRLKLDLEATTPDWPQFCEVFQRRHAIVHSDARADKSYLSKVDFDAVRWPVERPSLGVRFECDEEYIGRALDLFEVAGVTLAHAFWRKLSPDDEERWDTYPSAYGVHGVVYDAVLRHRWYVVETASAFAITDPVANEENRLVCQFNRLLARKRLGGLEPVRNELEILDLSAKHPRFRLVRASLLEDADEFFKILPEAGLTMVDLRDWPILDEMRGDERFITALARALGNTDVLSGDSNADGIVKLHDAITASESEATLPASS